MLSLPENLQPKRAVFVGSRVTESTSPGALIYNLCKSAQAAIALTLARETSIPRPLCFVLNPGLVDTDLTQYMANECAPSLKDYYDSAFPPH
jgi:hypothetical protein